MKNRKKKIFFILLLCLSLAFITHHFSFAKYHHCLQIFCDDDKHCFLDINIEKTKIPIEIITGTQASFELREKILNNIKEKKILRLCERQDCLGNTFYFRVFLIPKIQIGDIVLKNIEIQEISEDLIKKTKDEQNGSIGYGFFSKYNVFLDLAKNRIFLSNNLTKLKHSGFDIKTSEKIKFTGSRIGAIIPVTTDYGIKKLSVNTGANYNILRASKQEKKEVLIPSSNFIIGKTNFKNCRIGFTDISSQFMEIDGFLGMDFFLNHKIYIDFKKNHLYVEK